VLQLTPRIVYRNDHIRRGSSYDSSTRAALQLQGLVRLVTNVSNGLAAVEVQTCELSNSLTFQGVLIQQPVSGVIGCQPR
jgi:hypothetical protein